MQKGTVKKTTGMGTAVSVMLNPDSDIPDEQKTFFDWLKDGNMDKVKQMIVKDPSIINIVDEEVN